MDIRVNCSLPLTPAPDSTDNFSKKRTAPSDEDPNALQKFKRRRAPHACLSCRARKVRCNAVDGAPCLNCRSDNIDCIVNQVRPKKINAARSTATDVGSDRAQLRHGTIPMDRHRTPTRYEGTARIMDTGFPLLSDSLDGNDTSDTSVDRHAAHLFNQCDTGYFRDAEPLQHIWSCDTSSGSPWKDFLGDDATHSADRPITLFLKNLEIQDTIAHLPLFVRPLPASISPEAVQYLHRMGAFALPGIPLQEALLRAYVEYINPSMPLMDLHRFFSIVHCRDGHNGQISLLLFQSVMFAAAAFVDMKFLHEEGYKTRKEARKEFFKKTRLLYDFDYEQDSLVVVQTLIHMTYWDESPGDKKHSWHWMSLAISLSQSIGLHRQSKCATMTPLDKRLRKRVWWSCFMRDRILALGMRRPPMIEDGGFDVLMLSESDFEFQKLPEGNTPNQLDSVLIKNAELQQKMAIMCIAAANLCITMGRMLQAQYSVINSCTTVAENITDNNLPSITSQLRNAGSVHAVILELNIWADSLPVCCQYRPLNVSDIRDGNSPIAVQRTLLHLLYQTTIWVLYSPRLVSPLATQQRTRFFQAHEMSWRRARDAATKITNMVTELHQLRLDRFLPTTGVTVILPAVIMHLVEMQNTSPQARIELNQCVCVIEQLQETYTVADSAAWFISAALGKSVIDMDLSAGQSTLSLMKNELLAGVISRATPPENLPCMGTSKPPVEKAMDQIVKPSVLLSDTINVSTLDLSTSSLPQHDFKSPEQQKSASGESDEKPGDIDKLSLNLLQSYDDDGWQAGAEINFDVEQWLESHEDNGLNADVVRDECVND